MPFGKDRAQGRWLAMAEAEEVEPSVAAKPLAQRLAAMR